MYKRTPILIIMFIFLLIGAVSANPNDCELVQIDSTHWNFQTNQTDLSDAIYDYTAYVQDYDVNITQTATQYITIDTTPPTAVTLLTPVDGYHTNVNQTAFDWTDSVDYSTVYYNLLISTDSSFAVANITHNMTGIPASTYTLTAPQALPDGTYYWKVRANESLNGYGDWSANGNFSVTIDTVNPIWILGNYPKSDNTTVITTSITWDAKVTDSNLYRILLNVTDASGTAMETNYTSDWNATWFNFTHTTDTSNWTMGAYTVELSATDDHTDTDTDLKKGKKGESILVFNSTSTNTEIRASFVEKNDKITDTPGDFVSDISEKENGQYKFGYNFTVLKPETKLILNIVSDDKLVYRTPASGIVGHFVWENYYIDFADVPSDMKVTVTKISAYNYIVRIEGNTPWTAGQKIVIDPVAGGLNTVTEYYLITVTSPPATVTVTANLAGTGSNYATTTTVNGASWSASTLGGAVWDFMGGLSVWEILGAFALVTVIILFIKIFIDALNGRINMMALEAALLASVSIVVLFIIIPFIGSIFTDVGTSTDDVSCGSLTLTDGTDFGQVVVIGTETFTFTDGTPGAFNVDISANRNPTYSASQLVAEINANSTLVTAV